MAILNAKSRAGAANLGTPLMILSFAVIAGFLFWLSATAEPTAVVVREPGDAESGDVVSMAAFSSATQAFLDKEIEIREISVASKLGPHAFWTTLIDDTPYLIRLGPDLIAEGADAVAGSIVDIVGTVRIMSDSILNDWEDGGGLPGPADRVQAEFAEDFMEITSLEEVAPPVPSS